MPLRRLKNKGKHKGKNTYRLVDIDTGEVVAKNVPQGKAEAEIRRDKKEKAQSR